MLSLFPMLRPTRSERFRSVGDVDLRVHIVGPQESARPRPAIVFFFGGGFSFGSALQFLPFCHAFAAQGFVALSAEYRVSSRHRTDVRAAISDARAATEWIFEHAHAHGIDATRVVVAGASAGGLLAASLALSADARPLAGLVLYNPLTDSSLENAPRTWRVLRPLLGENPRAISPLHQVRRGAPPTFILHGERDWIIPVSHSVRFQEALLRAEVPCELERVPGRGHGFFNYGFGRFDDAVARTLAFLRRHRVC